MNRSKKFSKILALVIMLALVLTILPMGAMATVPTYNNIEIQFGDPNYSVTWPESSMSLRLDDADTHTYTALYNNNANSSYYPSILSLYAYYGANNGVTLTSNNTTNIQFVTYDQYGNETVDADGVMNYNQNSNWNPDANNGAGAMVNSNLFAIKINGAGSITIATANNQYTVTINFLAPASTSASAGDNPDAVCGYLPVGQFARPNSFGWGTIFTDGTNVYTSSKTPKFLSGLETTGVSLGMLGGFVQYEFEDAIGNNANNKYGIDFIVYGNAFVGNPEAGSVMVYGKNTATNKYGWYNLAGSRHYMSGTEWDVNISYIKINSDNTTIGNSTFGKKGVYYSTNFDPPASDNTTDVNSAISAAAWYAIPNASTATNPVSSANTTGTSPNNTVANGYWPEREANENYKYVWKMWASSNGSTVDEHVGGVYWFTTGTAPVITYMGVTRVQDDDVVLANTQNVTQAMMTNVYQWGYADVRENGSNYGTAINPYASDASAVAGGDGFDLSWAVDTEGKPVNLTDVHFVRVYSAVLFNAGVFGETSTEVCGVYVASGGGSNTINSPTSISVTATSGTTSNKTTTNNGWQNVRLAGASTAYIKVTSTSSYVFINGEAVTSGTEKAVALTQTITPVQVITQNGTESPYITVFLIKNT